MGAKHNAQAWTEEGSSGGEQETLTLGQSGKPAGNRRQQAKLSEMAESDAHRQGGWCVGQGKIT